MTTTPRKRTIFRGKALQKYVQNQEKTVLPRVVAPPVFLLCWLLLMILTGAGLLAWWGQIPLYVSGSGMVLDKNTLPAQSRDEADAVIILSASMTGRVRVGLPAQVQVGESGPQVSCVVSAVSSTTLSPSEIRQQYGISVSDPSQVVSMSLGSSVPRQLYAGSPIRAQIRVGSQRLLALFPFLNNLPFTRVSARSWLPGYAMVKGVEA